MHKHKAQSIHYIYKETCVPICVLFTNFQCFTYYTKFGMPVKAILWENIKHMKILNLFGNTKNILFLLLEIYSS
jgi:hypothetical protein